MGDEARSLAFQHVPVQHVREEVARDVLLVISRRVGSALIDNSAAGDVTALEVAVGNVLEIAEREGVVQRPMLAEALDVIAALDLVKHGLAAPVGAGDDVAVAVEVEAP